MTIGRRKKRHRTQMHILRAKERASWSEYGIRCDRDERRIVCDERYWRERDGMCERGWEHSIHAKNTHAHATCLPTIVRIRNGESRSTCEHYMLCMLAEQCTRATIYVYCVYLHPHIDTHIYSYLLGGNDTEIIVRRRSRRLSSRWVFSDCVCVCRALLCWAYYIGGIENVRGVLCTNVWTPQNLWIQMGQRQQTLYYVRNWSLRNFHISARSEYRRAMFEYTLCNVWWALALVLVLQPRRHRFSRAYSRIACLFRLALACSLSTHSLHVDGRSGGCCMLPMYIFILLNTGAHTHTAHRGTHIDMVQFLFLISTNEATIARITQPCVYAHVCLCVLIYFAICEGTSSSTQPVHIASMDVCTILRACVRRRCFGKSTRSVHRQQFHTK